MSHIIASFICIALALIMVYLTKDAEKKELKIHYNIVACIISVMLVISIVWDLFQGQWQIENIIPISISLLFVLALWLMNSKKACLNKIAKVFVAYVGVAFGLLLLIVPVPSFTNYPLFHFKSMFALFTYTSMFCLGLMHFATKEVEINSKNLKLATFLIFDVIVDCLILNTLLNANFLFLFSPDGMNIEWLNNVYIFNNNIYSLLMFGFYFIPVLAVYLVYKLADILIKKYNSEK